MLPELSADSLYVFAFGPGVGELIAVRAPGDEWLVVDGCGVGGEPYGLRLLEHYGARAKVLVLTHPHLDHAKGVGDVVDAATQGPRKEWPAIGLVLPPWIRGAADLTDLPRAYQGGVAEEAVSTILDRWERSPACRWDLRVGETRRFGEAEVRVAAPSMHARLDAEARAKDGRRIEPNRLATVLLVTWASHRIVLGSDLVEDVPEGWHAALATVPELAAPSVLKVAHHGSLPAQHEPLLDPPHATVLVATPFATQRLPKFEDGEGAHWLLDRAPELLLTGLPRSYAEQGVHPDRAARTALAADGRGGVRSPRVPGFPDCGCVIELPRAGPARTILGPGAISVTP